MATQYPRFGDKKNSSFFEEYLMKIYEERDRSGVSDNVGLMRMILIQVETEEREAYLKELSLMTRYTFKATYQGFGHLFTVMELDAHHPAMVVMSDLTGEDKHFRAMNEYSVRGAKKPSTRYLGEIFTVQNVKDLEATLRSQGVRFLEGKLPFLMTAHSEYTWNHIGYMENVDERGFLRDGFTVYEESAEFLAQLASVKEKQAMLGIAKNLEPIDHLATRVLSQDREHALLEFLKLSSYYYWGSYMIGDQNSSTNVTRNSKGVDEYISPAKVFTAAETPYYLDYITGLPSPTEEFVIQYGRRIHHIAHGIKDNVPGQEMDSVDLVVNALKNEGIEFLLQVIGSEAEGMKQIFSRASKNSMIITEYVQRFNGYQGFFTRENVAFLTKAAAAEYSLSPEQNLVK